MPDPGSSPGQALISLLRQVVSRGHPVFFWIPAFAGMTALSYLIAEVIKRSD